MSYLKPALIFCISMLSTISFAQPPGGNVRGKLVFLGVTNDLSQSVWLSATTAGAFQLEAQGQQLIDTWDMTRRGIHLSLSPIVSQGNGGTHFLINRLNNKKLDSQNQRGGIVFPPLPPPIVTNPIPPFPEHPIVIPPGSPSVPGTPTHPIVIPPGSPSVPGTPTHPIVIPPGSPPSVSHPIQPSPGHPIVTPPGPNQKPVHTTKPKPPATSTIPFRGTQAGTSTYENADHISQQAPITEARQFDQEKAWNIWSDNYYFNSNDGRNDLDAKGTTTNFVIGADRHIATNTVLGFLLSAIQYRYSAFNGDLKNQAHGFNIGPYFGYNISPKWSFNGSFTYGQWKNNNKIASLTSEYTTQVFHADVHATGLFRIGQFQLRPKPLISFTHFRNPAYQFNGVFRNRPFQVNRPKENFDLGFMELKLEGLYPIVTKKGNLIQPYVEPGIDYAFARPNDGQILTGNLDLASTAPVVESLTVGVRALLAKSFLIDASTSYLSFGQHGLDVWELRLLASYSFG